MTEMNTSIFPDKSVIPNNSDLQNVLNKQYDIWEHLRNFVFEKYPKGKEEWNFPGKKYGWSFRIKDKKRAILYLLPRDKSFKVAFVFGDKAVAKIMDSDISTDIKTELEKARKYAEGRGIGIDVINESILPDIEKLVEIKLSN